MSSNLPPVLYSPTGPRASGKTFRSLLLALFSASEGAEVKHVSPNAERSTAAFHRAIIILNHGVSVEEEFVINRRYHTIEFPSKGSIEFVSVQRLQRFRGKPPEILIDDSRT